MAARGLLGGDGKNRAQLSLEFLLVYSVVLIVFLVIFAMVVSQRAATLSTQDYSTMQLMAQTVASEVDSALSSGSGYSATVQLPPGIGALSYNISVSSSGVVTASTKVGKEVVSAQAYSSARNLVINGTVVAQGSGISVYQIPAYRGSVYVANSEGTIYLDEQPASTLSLAGNLNVGVRFNGESAGFNGRNSYVYSTLPTTKTTNVTIVVWVYVPSIFDHGAFVKIGGNITGYGGYGIGVGGTNWDNAGNELWGLYENVRFIDSGRTIGTGWHDVVFEVNSSGVPYFYLDGKFIVAVTGTGPIAPGTIVTIGSDYPASGTRYFNGSIANVQVYNTALSSLKIQQLYNEGIGGVPISNASLAGWWPLNGNANDYSGYGDHGAPRNVSFYGTAQIDAHVSNHNGGNAVGDIVGFTSTAGSFGSQRGEYSTYSNANGNATAILTANTSSTQLANITVTAFNGNYTIAGNVVGWWPLNIGSGNTIYDLSTHNNNGAFVNNAWSTANNQTSFLSASFPGQYRANITSRLIYKNTTPTTITAWIDPTSFTVADGGSNIVAYGGLFALYSNHLVYYTCGIGNTKAGTINANQWTFVAATISASPNPTVTLYINGNMVSTYKYTGNTASSTGAGVDNLTIGGTGYPACNDMNFTGSMANVNVYNTTLSAMQINQLYQDGLNGVPISNSRLVGWWPLNGNANDYSGNNNNGIPANVLYKNLNNYVGNPLRYGAIYNSYNYMTVAGFGCNNVASCNSSSLSMPSSAYVLPITLKNSQSTAAPAPFQQMITLNPSAYSAYEASNLGNIRFYQNGTELYSWCESGCSTASSNATFWVRLPKGIPANSNITISMVFGATSANYDGVYAGEAPQLSPTYGEYDNGQNVFNFYDNFAGTSLNSKWGNTGAYTYSVNNMLDITGGNCNQIGIYSTTSFSDPYIIDFYANFATNDDMGMWWNIQTSGSTSSNTNLWAIRGSTAGGDTLYTGNPAPSSFTGYNTGSPTGDGNWHVYTLISGSGNNPVITQRYYSTYINETNFPNSYLSGDIGPRYCGGSYAEYYWTRVRAYPPNGVMPSVTFGRITPYSPSSSQNALDSINGALLPDAAVFNGASGYVGIPGSSSPNLPSSATVSMWIYPYANTSTYSNIEGKGTGQPFIQLYHVNQIYQVIAGIWGVGQTARATIPSKAWSFITATYSPTSNTVTVYINGAYALNSTMPGGISSNTNPLQLGSTSPTFSNGGYFNGSMVDVQLYNTTLSTSQVRELYLNNSVSGISSISYWPLNGGIGGLMNVTPNLVSGSSYGQLYSGSTICTNADVINGVCGVNYATLSGK